jgi:tRNA-specific 2-thiouridylase
MKIAVLLSGGVDSSVALRLLQEQGHRDLTAFYLKVWLEDELYFPGCPWEEDLKYARAVCADAGVALEVIPLQLEYWERVVSYTVSELKAGRTPSPDIFCNQLVKFGVFLDRIGDAYDRVATGHYARVSAADGYYLLRKGVDPVKDQTYFLSYLSQKQLSRSLFPLGELTKTAVREIARRFALATRERPDSQGICFLGRIRFNDFVRSQLGEKAGEIRERESGRVLGAHRGYWFHTIGQRRGLGLSQGPWFVVEKDVEKNIVYVSHQERLAASSRNRFEVSAPHWIARPPGREDLDVKLRHGERVYRSRLLEGVGGRFTVELDGADPGIAPGQFAVFYDGDLCVGAASIYR